LDGVGNMRAMKRLLLFFVLAASALALLPATADAKTPCRNQIYNDWYRDGQIASTYPLACYRDALAHVRNGDTVYTSLEDDIRSALQAAIDRGHGKKVADQIGHKFTTTDSQPVLVDQHDRTKTTKTSTAPSPGDTHDAAPVVASSASSSSGIPVPLLVLGALALVLIAAGGLGLVVRRRSGGPAT
jgi:hypothetical protein